MRLSEFERQTLKRLTLVCFEDETVARLFGFRLADEGKGGDIDLLIETRINDPAQIAQAHTRFLSMVYSTMGEQKVDVLIDYPTRSQRPPVYEVAKTQGVII